jgi:hypothetical protein
MNIQGKTVKITPEEMVLGLSGEDADKPLKPKFL